MSSVMSWALGFASKIFRLAMTQQSNFIHFQHKWNRRLLRQTWTWTFKTQVTLAMLSESRPHSLKT